MSMTMMMALAAAALQPAEPSWSDKALMDLEAIREAVAEGTPALHDPANPSYARWYENGYPQAQYLARQADGFGDYIRALRFYTAGFEDSHIAAYIEEEAPDRLVTPHLLGSDADGNVVVVGSKDARIAVGDRLLGCDGKSALAWVGELVTPFYGNRAIPHSMGNSYWALTFGYGGDEDRLPKRCTFAREEEQRIVDLDYRLIPNSELNDLFAELRASGSASGDTFAVDADPDLSWVRVGTFMPSDDMDAFQAEVADKVEALRSATALVLDIRGNGGGWSGKADLLLRTLFGETLQQQAYKSLDWTLDYRASQYVLDAYDYRIENMIAGGASEADVTRIRNARANLVDAVAAGEPLVAYIDEDNPPPVAADADSPVQGKVYILADAGCGSACLDFLDSALQMPNVTLIGQPTHADAIYNDVLTAPLPSGYGQVVFPKKVFRNRVRDHNQWYSPEIAWPGGPMTDEAVRAWVKRL
ncbi:S41 family peptidase [Sphingomicrobium arenosum]|uniref:S41 family peptidase n=1 Tax=Sphingomicrobium arenosum TaxID=2233861 RepID=UPI00224104FE|nr:S41 family peptidase [Sphingomicrobium arenosum]